MHIKELAHKCYIWKYREFKHIVQYIYKNKQDLNFILNLFLSILSDSILVLKLSL